MPPDESPAGSRRSTECHREDRLNRRGPTPGRRPRNPARARSSRCHRWQGSAIPDGSRNVPARQRRGARQCETEDQRDVHRAHGLPAFGAGVAPTAVFGRCRRRLGCTPTTTQVSAASGGLLVSQMRWSTHRRWRRLASVATMGADAMSSLCVRKPDISQGCSSRRHRRESAAPPSWCDITRAPLPR
jgi:hypothetical protein